MIKTLIAILVTAVTTVSIYSIHVPSLDNETMSFSSFQGKKILIVNTASASPRAGQLVQLEQLYQLYHDSLVVVAFPSNSFGAEPRSGAALLHHMRDSLGITFPIADLSKVRGPEINMIFRWLASRNFNGHVDATAETDFQKFLVDRKGNLVGLFDSSVSPIGTAIQTAVQHTGE
jgi:glutathione peroxidase